MKTLLNDIKTKLNSDLTYIKNIEVVPHELLIPDLRGYPAIGLLDSGDKLQVGKHQGIEILTVTIAAYQKVLSAKDASVMGNSQEKGVLDIVADIKTSLDGEYFSGAANLVKYLGSNATRVVTGDYKNYTAFKLCKFEYHRVAADS